MNATELWRAARVELDLQMAKAAFDTWVRPTEAVAFDGSEIVLRCPSEYAKQWLENRLHVTVARVMTGIVGHTVAVRYEVREASNNRGTGPGREDPGQTHESADDTDGSTAPPQPGDILVDLIDPPTKPFILLQKYAVYFWQPLLGSVAFATWLVFRCRDKQNEGIGQRHKYNLDVLACTLNVHRQAITGVRREGGQKWQPGAFDVLNTEKVAKIEQVGEGRQAIWWARVWNELPMLAPAQVARLDPLIQQRHETWLKDFAIDAERWEQIELPSLIT